MVDIEQLREALAENPVVDEGSGLAIFLADNAWTVYAAASELLALKENGQTVWWCEKHRAGHLPGWQIVVACPFGFEEGPDDLTLEYSCRMVKASLHIHREGT